ncbi:MAG: PA0069 family radical SAM protein [Pseudomonadota bacterium]
MKGRGAQSNPAGRFCRQTTEPDPAPPPAQVATRVTMESCRQVISRNQSPDIPFNLSVNPYRGCEHGCIYCYARPGHAYLGLSPGLDFETQIFAKAQAAQCLARELRKPSYRCEVIALGANTDAYQPAERRLRITRSILEVMQRFQQPVSVITKSSLVLRDIDLLKELAQKQLAQVSVSITTLSAETKRRLEPRTASGDARLRVVRELAEAGIPVSVMVAPVIPKITEHELEDILAAARDAGATSAGYILLRLPAELESLFAEWLTEHYPNRRLAVMSMLRQCHNGQVYRGGFGKRMRGEGPLAGVIQKRFLTATRKLGLRPRELRLNTSRFAPPQEAGRQLSLF